MSLAFIAIGILLIYLATKNKTEKKARLALSVKTLGQVVEIKTRWGAKSRSYSPRVVFKTEQNRTIDFVSPYASSFSPYQIGQQVEVYYNPRYPKIAGLLRDANEQATGAVYTIFGVIIAVFGAGFLVVEIFAYVVFFLIWWNIK
jgi:hypothetical protein